jgi:hypothetical protein
MPRIPKSTQTPAKVEQQRLLWEQTGSFDGNGLEQWDPKTQELVDAILTVLSTGSSVFIRPGSGGRSLGIAIWEGEVRHKPKWIYDAEEMDQWAEGILHIAKLRLGDISQ